MDNRDNEILNPYSNSLRAIVSQYPELCRNPRSGRDSLNRAFFNVSLDHRAGRVSVKGRTSRAGPGRSSVLIALRGETVFWIDLCSTDQMEKVVRHRLADVISFLDEGASVDQFFDRTG